MDTENIWIQVFAKLSDKEDEKKRSIEEIYNLGLNYICLFNYLFISSQMSAKPYFIGSTGILLLW